MLELCWGVGRSLKKNRDKRMEERQTRVVVGLGKEAEQAGHATLSVWRQCSTVHKMLAYEYRTM